MRKIRSKYETFREKIKIILYGTNTVLGRLFDLVLLGLILLSVLLVMMETVQGINQKYHSLLLICEWIITIFFTIEYILRIISIQKPINIFLAFMALSIYWLYCQCICQYFFRVQASYQLFGHYVSSDYSKYCTFHKFHINPYNLRKR